MKIMDGGLGDECQNKMCGVFNNCCLWWSTMTDQGHDHDHNNNNNNNLACFEAIPMEKVVVCRGCCVLLLLPPPLVDDDDGEEAEAEAEAGEAVVAAKAAVAAPEGVSVFVVVLLFV
jgi:hypothetical protein